MALQRGKQLTPIKPKLGPIRSLAREDLTLLTERREPGAIITKLRDPHHRLARAVAAGLKHVEISSLLGVSANRISMLLKDPAFNDLVSKYRGQVDEAFIRQQDAFMETATSNMLKAENMIAEKLEAAEETGEFLPTRDLLAISRDAADRFGYGKKNTTLNVNADFAAILEAARRRSDAARQIGSGASTPLTQSDGSEVLPPARSASIRRL